MSVERKLILVKLIGFLTGEISKNEIYEWALFVVVSRDYEELVKSDKLSEHIFQFLIDIHKPRTTETPTKKILEYFIACLEDKKQFSAEEYQVLISDQPAKSGAAAVKAGPAAKPRKISLSGLGPGDKKKFSKEYLVPLIAKVYVLLFVIISLILNLIVVLKPDFLVKEGEITPIPEDVLRDAFPHLFYGITMIIALFLRGPRFLFIISFFIATWGMFFYWYSMTIFIFQNKWPLYYLVMLAPVLTLPPTMMFLIMLTRWFHIRQPDTVAGA